MNFEFGDGESIAKSIAIGGALTLGALVITSLWKRAGLTADIADELPTRKRGRLKLLDTGRSYFNE